MEQGHVSRGLPAVIRVLKTPEKPELIAKFRVDSVSSGECSHCHEVIVVKNAAVDTSKRLSDLLEETFAEHVAKNHMQ